MPVAHALRGFAAFHSFSADGSLAFPPDGGSVCGVSKSWKATAPVWLLFAATVAISGCVSSRAFVPAEHVTAFSPEGSQLAAEYPIVESGQSLADVKVWSAGAVRDGGADDPRTTVSIGFELDNHGDTPLRLDTQRLYLEEMTEKGIPSGRVAPVGKSEALLVPPGESRQVEVSFALPSSVWPSDVPGYRVAWSVVGQRAHSRKTPFLRATETRGADPWYPYSPSYYGYYYYPGYYYAPWSYGYRGWPPPPFGVRRF